MLNTKVSIWLVLLALFVGIAASGYISLTGLRDVLWAEKRHHIKEQVDQAVSVIDYHQHLVETHQLSLAEAQRRAADILRSLRYAKEGYFWVNGLDHTLIVHPFRLALEGKSMFNFQDKEGVYVYREFVTTAQSPQGSGFLVYYRARPGFENSEEQLPKLSYVKRVESWGWVVGTGIYVDDIEKVYDRQLNNQLSLWMVLLLAVSFGGFMVALVWRNDRA
jgi:methyl-accepting chemotaxis protein